MGFLLLIARLVVLMSISDDANLRYKSVKCSRSKGEVCSYALNGAESTKLALQITFISIIAESSNNQGLESIASNVRVFIGSVCRTCQQRFFNRKMELLTSLSSIPQSSLDHFFLLPLLPILHLEPTLSRLVNIGILILSELWEKGGDTRDGRGLANLRRMIWGHNPSQGWSRRKKGEQVGGEFIRHRDMSTVGA